MILRTTGSVNPITVEVKAAQPLRFRSEYRCELGRKPLPTRFFASCGITPACCGGLRRRASVCALKKASGVGRSGGAAERPLCFWSFPERGLR